MKKAIILLLMAIMLPANGLCDASAYTLESLLDDWSNRYIDAADWASAWLKEGESDKAALPSEAHISQREALRCAVEAVTQLGFETPESLSKEYEVKFGFFYEEQYDIYFWQIDLYRWAMDRRLNLYTVQVDASAGRVFALHSFASFYAYDANFMYALPKLPDQYDEQDSAVDALIDRWDALYAESPAYSPEVQRREVQGYPLPGEGDMTQREALRIALQMARTLSNCDIEEFYSYMPQVEFDVSPAASRWDITLRQDAQGTEGQAFFSFTINATVDAVEKIAWRYLH